jgi:plasmid stabilization system protein ParE
MRYWLHPEAENDLRDAAEFYRDRADSSFSNPCSQSSSGRWTFFYNTPGLGALWRSDRRRLIMKRFPYSLIYTVVGEQIRILAVAHHSRRPIIGAVEGKAVGSLQARQSNSDRNHKKSGSAGV